MAADAAPLCSTMIGDIRVSFLPDGIHHVRPLAQYDGSTPELWAAHGQYLDDDGWLIMSLGSLLVETGDRKVLIDLAWGPRSIDIGELTFGEHEGDMIGGGLLDNLARAGLQPEDVDSIVYSHLHPDHIGWVSRLDDGTAVFPNATHYVGDLEWTYWHEGPEAGGFRSPNEAQFAVMAERLVLAADGFSPAPGVNFMLTPGHTPGHCSLVISSGNERAVILGDSIHCPIEISVPELDFVFDVDPVLARRTKERIEKELEAPNTIVAGGHFPDLIFGRLMPGAARGLQFSPAQIAS